MYTHSPDPSNNTPFYAKSAGHVTRPYQGISLPKSKYPGYEVGARNASGFRPNKTRPASFLNGFKNVCIISQIFI